MLSAFKRPWVQFPPAPPLQERQGLASNSASPFSLPRTSLRVISNASGNGRKQTRAVRASASWSSARGPESAPPALATLLAGVPLKGPRPWPVGGSCAAPRLGQQRCGVLRLRGTRPVAVRTRSPLVLDTPAARVEATSRLQRQQELIRAPDERPASLPCSSRATPPDPHAERA